ncbi:hypothetical protein GTO10_06710 [Candidatus Saccharibacteria bacterium]|nr:hypothetical protein [Candidatus Saccharibacteria bacterium]
MPLVRPGTTKTRIRRRASSTSASAKGTLKKLLVSQVRIDILKLFLLKPEARYHVRAITRRVGAEINAVRRELENLISLGLLTRTSHKNRLIYSLREDFTHLNELLGLLVKEEGIGRALSGGRGLGEIKFAFISIPFLRGRTPEPTDIDLLVVGGSGLTRKITNLVQEEEKRRKQEINYAVLTEKEFEELKKRRDPLILKALLQPKVILTTEAQQYLTI